jgi:Zn-dependent protease
MFGRGFKIATIGGIPVNVDASWLWIAVVAVYTLWARFEGTFGGLSSTGALAYAILAAALFFGSVLLHELAHAVAARSAGIRVQGITLVFFGGFTAARADEKGPVPALVIAAVGPATSLVLGGVFWVVSRMTAEAEGPLSGVFGYVGWVNLFMAAFNVLPGLPLDGGRVLQSAVWRLTGNRTAGTRVAAYAGMALGGVLLAAAVVAASTQDLYLAIWAGIVGLFIFQGARAAQAQVGVADRLASATVADAMEAPPPAVPADMTLSEALDRFLRGHEDEAFPVVSDGRVLGMVSFDSARELGSRDPLRPVREATIPLQDVLVASPDEPLDHVAERLGTGKAALVLRDGQMVGSITDRGLYRFASRSR